VTERKRWITGVVVGGLVGFAIYKLLKATPEERPPIRVRGGSIYFDTACGWIEGPSADEWMQDLQAPPPVAGFVVDIHRGGSTIRQRGTQVHIDEGPELRKLRIDNGEPRLGPRNRLPKEIGGHQRVKDAHQNLDNVHVIPGHSRVDLRPGDWIDIAFD
jgi:hypothetical protein